MDESSWTVGELAEAGERRDARLRDLESRVGWLEAISDVSDRLGRLESLALRLERVVAVLLGGEPEHPAL